jgi:hypothetical protein
VPTVPARRRAPAKDLVGSETPCLGARHLRGTFGAARPQDHTAKSINKPIYFADVPHWGKQQEELFELAQEHGRGATWESQTLPFSRPS